MEGNFFLFNPVVRKKALVKTSLASKQIIEKTKFFQPFSRKIKKFLPFFPSFAS